MLRHPDRWPAPAASRIRGRALLYDLSALESSSAVDRVPLSRKAATVSDEDGLIPCLECGRRMRSLARHLTTQHHLTADEYRARHGLPRTAALRADQTRRRLTQIAHQQHEERAAALAPYQGRERLAGLQQRGVDAIRDSMDRAVVREHREPAQQRGVAAMLAARAAQLDERARAAGYASLHDAIERTSDLSAAAAARRIGVSAQTVTRHRTKYQE